MNNEELGRPDITDVEGIVWGADTFGVKIIGEKSGAMKFEFPLDLDPENVSSYMTTPWHSQSKWYVDIDSLPEGFESDYVLEDDPPHVEHHSQDEWTPNPKINESLVDNYNPPKVNINEIT